MKLYTFVIARSPHPNQVAITKVIGYGNHLLIKVGKTAQMLKMSYMLMLYAAFVSIVTLIYLSKFCARIV